jgi:hypothetical protein
MTLATPLLILPGCHARGCEAAGDQYSMVLCRKCHEWFCAEHIDTHVGVELRSADSPRLRGLSYYQGLCLHCRKAKHH